MSQNPLSPWSPPFVSCLFNTPSPVTIPTSPQGIAAIVEITPLRAWDVVLSPNANAPKVEQAHWDVSQLDTNPPTSAPAVKVGISPSPVSYPQGPAMRVAAFDVTANAPADFVGAIAIRGYRVGPLA